jgi:hypothetical protein
MKLTVHQCEKCGQLFKQKDDLEPVRIRKHVWQFCARCIDLTWDWLCNGGVGPPDPLGEDDE